MVDDDTTAEGGDDDAVMDAIEHALPVEDERTSVAASEHTSDGETTTTPDGTASAEVAERVLPSAPLAPGDAEVVPRAATAAEAADLERTRATMPTVELAPDTTQEATWRRWLGGTRPDRIRSAGAAFEFDEDQVGHVTFVDIPDEDGDGEPGASIGTYWKGLRKRVASGWTSTVDGVSAVGGAVTHTAGTAVGAVTKAPAAAIGAIRRRDSDDADEAAGASDLEAEEPVADSDRAALLHRPLEPTRDPVADDATHEELHVIDLQGRLGGDWTTVTAESINREWIRLRTHDWQELQAAVNALHTSLVTDERLLAETTALTQKLIDLDIVSSHFEVRPTPEGELGLYQTSPVGVEEVRQRAGWYAQPWWLERPYAGTVKEEARRVLGDTSRIIVGTISLFVTLFVADVFATDAGLQWQEYSVRFLIWPVGLAIWTFGVMWTLHLDRSILFLAFPWYIRLQAATGAALILVMLMHLLGDELRLIETGWAWMTTVVLAAMLLSGVTRTMLGIQRNRSLQRARERRAKAAAEAA